MYTSTFCKNFLKFFQLPSKGFRLVEVEFFGSVNWLSHGECLYNGLIVSLDGGEKVFERGVWRIRSRFGEVARFD
jgi:hypothetical protein